MKKETLLSYIGKGIVNHEGYMINVTNDYLEKTKYHYLQIELKPINPYTDSVFFSTFLENTDEKSFEKLEKSFEEAYEKMRRQEQLNNREPLKLSQIDNICGSSIASFKDENNREYILRESKIEGKVELVKFYIEPEYNIGVPVEINGEVIKPNFSFWLESSIYDEEEFMKVLDLENVKDEEVEDMEEI